MKNNKSQEINTYFYEDLDEDLIDEGKSNSISIKDYNLNSHSSILINNKGLVTNRNYLQNDLKTYQKRLDSSQRLALSFSKEQEIERTSLHFEQKPSSDAILMKFSKSGKSNIQKVLKIGNSSLG